MKEKSCKTCKHSRWSLSPTGRIQRNESGRCVATFTPPLIPACICPPVWRRVAIWPEDGADCPLYERSEGKPIAIEVAELEAVQLGLERGK